MNPSFSNQIIVRAVIWAFVFMSEILISYVVKQWYIDLGHNVIYVSSAFFLLLSTWCLGQSTVLVDIRDLCFYDVLVQLSGWWVYQNNYNLEIYYSFTYFVLALKFTRLVWPCHSKEQARLADWPIFGPFGYWQAKKHHGRPLPDLFALSQHDKVVYAVIVSCAPLIHFYRSFGGKTPLAFWALIGFVIILVFFRPFIAYLDRREKQYLEHERKATALQVAQEKNVELAEKNRQLAYMNAALQENNTKLILARQAEQEKQAALEQVNRLNDALCEASHDLRGPMAGVNRHALELMQSVNKPAEIREEVAGNLDRAMKFLYQSLDSTIHDCMLATGLSKPEIRAVNVLQMFDQLFDDWINEARCKGFDCIRRYPKGVLRVPVAADKQLLWRILHNLVMNSLMHGRPACTLVMSVRMHGKVATVRVWDTGPGIPDLAGRDMEANFLQLLARPRPHKNQRTKEGHGLGLHIVWKLSQVLGIRMGVRSYMGRGTLFRFDLPLADQNLILTTAQADKAEAALLAKAGMDAGSGFRGAVLWPRLLN